MPPFEQISAAAPTSSPTINEPLTRLDAGPAVSLVSRFGRRIDRYFFRPARAFDLGLCRFLFFLGVLIFHLPHDLHLWVSVPRHYWRPIWLFSTFHLPLMSVA